jgi:hypothetical protein
MFDFLRTPGGALTSNDKELFERARALIDSATSDMLIRVDWGAQMAVVDCINQEVCVGSGASVVLSELFFYIRSAKLKGGITQPVAVAARTAFYALTLVETVVKNGGPRVHQALNDPSFMSAIGALVRKYNRSSTGHSGGASQAFASNSEVMSLY